MRRVETQSILDVARGSIALRSHRAKLERAGADTRLIAEAIARRVRRRSHLASTSRANRTLTQNRGHFRLQVKGHDSTVRLVSTDRSQWRAGISINFQLKIERLTQQSRPIPRTRRIRSGLPSCWKHSTTMTCSRYSE